MTTLPQPLCTRKDIAALIDCSPRMVKRNERRWGLEHARADFNGREVRYRTAVVIIILRRKRWVE